MSRDTLRALAKKKPSCGRETATRLERAFEVPFSDRVSVSGPDVFVDRKMVQTFCLVLHELATNAAKYGSLSNDVGTVAVAWSVEKIEPDARFHFRWQERDGPAVIAPGRQGFGSTLLERAFAPGQNLQAALSYEAAPSSLRQVSSNEIGRSHRPKASKRQGRPLHFSVSRSLRAKVARVPRGMMAVRPAA